MIALAAKALSSALVVLSLGVPKFFTSGLRVSIFIERSKAVKLFPLKSSDGKAAIAELSSAFSVFSTSVNAVILPLSST